MLLLQYPFKRQYCRPSEVWAMFLCPLFLTHLGDFPVIKIGPSPVNQRILLTVPHVGTVVIPYLQGRKRRPRGQKSHPEHPPVAWQSPVWPRRVGGLPPLRCSPSGVNLRPVSCRIRPCLPGLLTLRVFSASK